MIDPKEVLYGVGGGITAVIAGDFIGGAFAGLMETPEAPLTAQQRAMLTGATKVLVGAVGLGIDITQTGDIKIFGKGMMIGGFGAGGADLIGAVIAPKDAATGSSPFYLAGRRIAMKPRLRAQPLQGKLVQTGRVEVPKVELIPPAVRAEELVRVIH